MCRPLPPTKILHCPQCIKAKINSSIKGRSYLKHFFFFLKFLSHLQKLVHKKIIIIIKQKTKTKTKGKKKKEKKKKKTERKEN